MGAVESCTLSSERPRGRPRQASVLSVVTKGTFRLSGVANDSADAWASAWRASGIYIANPPPASAGQGHFTDFPVLRQLPGETEQI